MKGFKQGAQTGGLLEHGTKVLGFKKGGQVKASPDFVMKTKPMDPGDDGNMPKSEAIASKRRKLAVVRGSPWIQGRRIRRLSSWRNAVLQERRQVLT